MAVTVKLYYDGIGETMRMPVVRQALQGQATGIAQRARGLAGKDASSIGTEQGTRPKGRPYARATSTDVEEEFGTSTTERRRWLARGAGL